MLTHPQTPNNPQPEQIQNQILHNGHGCMKLKLLTIVYQENKKIYICT